MKQAAIFLALVVIIIITIPFWLPFFDGGVRARLNDNTVSFMDWTFRAARWLVVAGLVWVFARALEWVRRALFLTYPDERAMYPQITVFGFLARHMRALPAENQPNAQVAGAFVNGNVSRLPSSPLRRLAPVIDADPVGEPPLPLLTASQAVDVDPITRPHWLIVGQTGSGKSTATRLILSELARRYPMEYAVCEPGGVDWGTQAAAHSDEGIIAAIAAVHGEMLRRQGMLRQEDRQHITQLANPLPYLCLVCEEMDTLFGRLRHLDRNRADLARQQLRDITGMGRKPGVCLVAVATSATADIFDPRVRTNLANILLFRNSQSVAYAFGIDASLANLSPGSAYSVAHGQTVNFPMIARPNLPLSNLYLEDASPLLAAEHRLELPLSPADATTAVVGEEGAVLAPDSPTTTPAVVVGHTDEEYFEAWKRLGNITAVQRKFWPDQGPGGSHWIEVNEAVNRMRAKYRNGSLKGRL